MRSIGDEDPLLITSSFPHPSQDYWTGRLDLNRHLVRRPAATFVLRLSSDALGWLGLYEGDEVIVDRSIEPRPGHVIVVVADGRRQSGLYVVEHGQAVLRSDVGDVPLNASVSRFGVVTFGIRHLPGIAS